MIEKIKEGRLAELKDSVEDREVTVFNSKHLGGAKNINQFLSEIDAK